MRLAGIRAGDIVRVDDGLPFYALVIERAERRLIVNPITGPRGLRHASATQVTSHWRHVKTADR